MFFPEDVWIQIKAFLLLRMEGALFTRIGNFQLKNGDGGFELKCHVYYRMLMMERECILKRMMKFVEESHRKLRSINNEIEYMDFADDPDLWSDFRELQNTAYTHIQAIRKMDHFMNIYETSSIQNLLEILYSVYESSRFSSQYDDDIRKNFRFLHDSRRKVNCGYIDYIWEIEDEGDIEKIQYLCINPLLLLEKDGKSYAVAYSNGKSYWTTPRQQTSHLYIYMEWAKNIGKSFNLDDSYDEYSEFKGLLDLLGFPMANNYSHFLARII